MHVANEVPGYSRIAAGLNEHLPAIRLSAITAYELDYKVRKARASRERVAALSGYLRLFKVLPFSRQAAARAAELRIELEAAGVPIGQLDFMAAGHALAIGYTFVTDNVREFARVPRLRVENWLRSGVAKA